MYNFISNLFREKNYAWIVHVDETMQTSLSIVSNLVQRLNKDKFSCERNIKLKTSAMKRLG